MPSDDLVQIQTSDHGLRVRFLESSLKRIRHDNEPWDTINKACQTSGATTLTLDLENVNFLSSAVLGKIISLKRKTKADLVLCHVNDLLREVFEATGLDRVLKIEASPGKSE